MKAGRQRTFDKDIALERAMGVFWKNGYTGASLTDLTSAMGINKPSLYSAFGNKEKLFIYALEIYIEKYGSIHIEELFASNKKLSKKIETYLISIAEMVTDTSLPGGCFVAVSTSEAGGASLPENALHAVSIINDATQSRLIEFFKEELKKGNIKKKSQVEVLANYLFTLQFGLAVMARKGASRRELYLVINQACCIFE